MKEQELDLIAAMNSDELILKWFHNQDAETRLRSMSNERLLLAIYRDLGPSAQDQIFKHVVGLIPLDCQV